MKNLFITLCVALSITMMGCKKETPTENLVDVIVDNISDHPEQWSNEVNGLSMANLSYGYQTIVNTECNVKVSIMSIGARQIMSIYDENNITISTIESDEINKVRDAYNNRPKKVTPSPTDNTPEKVNVLIKKFISCNK